MSYSNVNGFIVILADNRDPEVSWQHHLQRGSAGGVDCVAPSGTPLYAPDDCVVSFIPNNGNAGNTVTMDFGNGWRDQFMHLSKFASGGRKAKGELVGWSGTSGGVDPHVHWHRIDAAGRRQNPWHYFEGSSGAGGGTTPVYNFSADTQKKLQQYVAKGGLYNGPDDGVLGENSWRAIQTWLSMYGLYGGPLDGIPGPKTYEGLQRVAAQPDGGYDGPIDGVFGPNGEAALNKWLTKQLVPKPDAGWVKWQTFLQRYGYDGPLDGDPGPNTWMAMQRFLAEKFGYTGPIDGDPGPNTLDALNRASAAGYPDAAGPIDPPPPPPPVTIWPMGEAGATAVDMGTTQKNFEFDKFSAVGGDLVLIKACGANADDSPYVAPYYLSQLSRARIIASLIKAHYFFNGKRNGVTPREFGRFCAQNVSAAEGDLFALDVEAEPKTGTVPYTPEESMEFIAGFRETFAGAKFLIYLNRSLMRDFDWSALVADGHELWLATLDGTRNPEPKWWPKVTIVQFNIGPCVGSDVAVDQNLILSSLDALRWKKPADPDPDPEPDAAEKAIEEIDAIIQQYKAGV